MKPSHRERCSPCDSENEEELIRQNGRTVKKGWQQEPSSRGNSKHEKAEINVTL